MVMMLRKRQTTEAVWSCSLVLLAVLVASAAGEKATVRELIRTCVSEGSCAVLGSSCIHHHPALFGGRKPLWVLALSEEALVNHQTEEGSFTGSPKRLLRVEEDSFEDEKPETIKLSKNSLHRERDGVRRGISPAEHESVDPSDRRLYRFPRSLGKEYVPAELPLEAKMPCVPVKKTGYHEKYPAAVKAAAKAAREAAVEKVDRIVPVQQIMLIRPEEPDTSASKRCISEEDLPDFKNFVYYDKDGSFTIEHYRYNSTCEPKACDEGVEFFPHPKYCDRYYICNPDLNIAHHQFCPWFTKFDYKLSLCLEKEEFPKTFCDPSLDCPESKWRN